MASDDLEQLWRWEHAGGTWELLARRPEGVSLALLTCAGGEQVALLESAQPDVVAYVDDSIRHA